MKSRCLIKRRAAAAPTLFRAAKPVSPEGTAKWYSKCAPQAGLQCGQRYAELAAANGWQGCAGWRAGQRSRHPLAEVLHSPAETEPCAVLRSALGLLRVQPHVEIGRASCRERV